MITENFILNPYFKSGLQKILDKETIAEKNHTHSTQEIRGLNTVLQQLINQVGPHIKLTGGYFAD